MQISDEVMLEKFEKLAMLVGQARANDTKEQTPTRSDAYKRMVSKLKELKMATPSWNGVAICGPGNGNVIEWPELHAFIDEL